MKASRVILNTQDAYLAVSQIDGRAALTVSVGDRGAMHSAGAVSDTFRLTDAELRSLISALTKVQAGGKP